MGSVLKAQLYPPPPPPRNDSVPIVDEAAWTLEPVCKGAENLAAPRIRPPDCPTAASRYTDHTIGAHDIFVNMDNK
jgi:hypothetical protein